MIHSNFYVCTIVEKKTEARVSKNFTISLFAPVLFVFFMLCYNSYTIKILFFFVLMISKIVNVNYIHTHIHKYLHTYVHYISD